MERSWIFTLLVVVYFFGCGDGEWVGPNGLTCQTDSDWIVPQSNIFDGGPGCDGIPALLNPPFTAASSVDFLEDEDLVTVAADGNGVKLYAHKVLDWHEIVNDDIDGRPLAVIYCPLTGTGMAWERTLSNGETTTFGVSGLLYNSNIIPYDRATRSNWSQQRLQCVNGTLAGEVPTIVNLPEMCWGDARRIFPDARVMNFDTGQNRPYGRYPYGDYRTNDDNLIFPVDRRDGRLPNKERVLGVVIDEAAKVFRYEDFSAGGISLVSSEVAGREVVVMGSTSAPEFMNAFYPRLADGTAVALRMKDGALTDDAGNQYDLLGRVTAGPGLGQRLAAPTAFIGYWFSWGAFYPGVEVF